MDCKADRIMSSSVVCVVSDATLDEVVKILADNKISGLPVVDPNNKVVGVITERDIVDFSAKVHVVTLIGTSGWISPHIDVTEMTKIKEGFELLSNTKVEKVMTRRPITAPANTHVNEIARLIQRRNVNRLPIVNENGEIVGIITRADLVSYLAGKEK